VSEDVADLPSPQLQEEVLADEGVVYDIQVLAVIPGDQGGGEGGGARG
jgi:hypothetical protein